VNEMLKNFFWIFALSISTATAVPAAELLGVDVNNNLIRIDSSSPGTTLSSVAISGIGGSSVLAMDVRILDNTLYILTDDKQIFTVDQSTGAANLFATLPTLTGSQFGFDFNPTNNNLRIVSNDNSSYAYNMASNALVPGANVAYGFGGPSNQNIVGSAYLNNDLSASTGTVLYAIDSQNDLLATHNAATGLLTAIGALGVDFTSRASFDILTVGVNNTAFAYSGNTLYTLNLLTGAATTIGNTDRTLFGLTAVSPVPEPSTWLTMMFGLWLVGLMGARQRRR
jgi:hypothetical protein